MTEKTAVDLEVGDGVATVTIRRPEALNALNETVFEQLERAFAEAVRRPEVRAVVLAGEGKAFVAGADIKFFIEHVEGGTVSKIVEFARRGQRVLRALETAPKPVLAKVDGLALGGGVELAMACHAVVATERATFGLPETGIGIYPGLGGTQRTARILGRELAKYLVLTGQNLDGKTAHEIGLAAFFTPSADADAFVRDLVARGRIPDKFAEKPVPVGWEAVVRAFSGEHVSDILAGKASSEDPRVVSAAKAIARKAPIALRLASELIDRGAALDLEDALELELEGQDEVFRTRDALHGLKSVGAYRPEFKGE